jgi:hypothetical protein
MVAPSARDLRGAFAGSLDLPLVALPRPSVAGVAGRSGNDVQLFLAQRIAALALGALRTPNAEQSLIASLTSADTFAAASLALLTYPPQRQPRFEPGGPLSFNVLYTYVAAADLRALDVFAAARAHDRPELRALGLWGAAEIQDARAEKSARELLKDGAPEVRAAALNLLVALRVRDASALVAAMLADARVMPIALDLARCVDPQGVRAPVTALAERALEPEVYTAALRALAELGGAESVQVLTRLTSAPSAASDPRERQRRVAAAQALARTRHPDTLRGLLTMTLDANAERANLGLFAYALHRVTTGVAPVDAIEQRAVALLAAGLAGAGPALVVAMRDPADAALARATRAPASAAHAHLGMRMAVSLRAALARRGALDEVTLREDLKVLRGVAVAGTPEPAPWELSTRSMSELFELARGLSAVAPFAAERFIAKSDDADHDAVLTLLGAPSAMHRARALAGAAMAEPAYLTGVVSSMFLREHDDRVRRYAFAAVLRRVERRPALLRAASVVAALRAAELDPDFEIRAAAARASRFAASHEACAGAMTAACASPGARMMRAYDADELWSASSANGAGDDADAVWLAVDAGGAAPPPASTALYWDDAGAMRWVAFDAMGFGLVGAVSKRGGALTLAPRF